MTSMPGSSFLGCVGGYFFAAALFSLLAGWLRQIVLNH
jgi:hypothetical protein